MVMRTIEITSISYPVDAARRSAVIKELQDLYGDTLRIAEKEDGVEVEGDLRNYKRRNRILWIMSGGKHGKNV